MTIAKPGSAAIAAATALLLTSCGGGTEVDQGFLDQSPRVITKAALKEMRDLDSVRILGRLGADEGGEIRIDVRTDGQRSCAGSIAYERGAVQLIATPDQAWLKADEDFWLTAAPSPEQGRQFSAKVGTSWVVSQGPTDELRDFCDVSLMLDGFKGRRDGGEGRLSKGAVELVGDTEAVAISAKGGGQSSTVWVAVDAPHRVVKIVTREGANPASVSFEEFGVEIGAEAPAPDDVVDLSAYATKTPRKG